MPQEGEKKNLSPFSTQYSGNWNTYHDSPLCSPFFHILMQLALDHCNSWKLFTISSLPGCLQACVSVLACSRVFRSAHGWSWRCQWLSPDQHPPALPWPNRESSKVTIHDARQGLNTFFLMCLVSLLMKREITGRIAQLNSLGKEWVLVIFALCLSSSSQAQKSFLCLRNSCWITQGKVYHQSMIYYCDSTGELCSRMMARL